MTSTPPTGEAPLYWSGRYVEATELDDGKIVRVSLNRPKYKNAQNRGLLVELDECLGRAEADDRVRAVILAGAGTTFSAGHDIGTAEHLAERDPGPDQHASYACHGGTLGGVEGRVRQEWHYFYDNTRRWRNLRKITIAEVQGQVLAAGL